jgi:hypothetical protein
LKLDALRMRKLVKGESAKSNRRSFDYVSRDETARASAQDDNFIYRELEARSKKLTAES